MDAQPILNEFQARKGPLDGQLQYGAGLSAVQIRKVLPHGMVFTGRYIPDLNAIVKIHVDTLAVEGVISSRNDVQGSLIFVRPAGQGPA